MKKGRKMNLKLRNLYIVRINLYYYDYQKLDIYTSTSAQHLHIFYNTYSLDEENDEKKKTELIKLKGTKNHLTKFF